MFAFSNSVISVMLIITFPYNCKVMDARARRAHRIELRRAHREARRSVGITSNCNYNSSVTRNQSHSSSIPCSAPSTTMPSSRIPLTDISNRVPPVGHFPLLTPHPTEVASSAAIAPLSQIAQFHPIHRTFEVGESSASAAKRSKTRTRLHPYLETIPTLSMNADGQNIPGTVKCCNSLFLSFFSFIFAPSVTSLNCYNVR